MTVNIGFTPQEEAIIKSQATAQGIPPAEIIRRLVKKYLPVPDKESVVAEVSAKNAAAIAYLDARLASEATDDAEEIAAVEAEYKELKQSLDANRISTGERRLFPSI